MCNLHIPPPSIAYPPNLPLPQIPIIIIMFNLPYENDYVFLSHFFTRDTFCGVVENQSRGTEINFWYPRNKSKFQQGIFLKTLSLWKTQFGRASDPSLGFCASVFCFAFKDFLDMRFSFSLCSQCGRKEDRNRRRTQQGLLPSCS